VTYGFAAPQKPLGFLAQENTATADRDTIQLPGVADTSEARLRNPTPFEFAVGDDGQFSGLLYRSEGTVGKAPALVYLADGPLRTRRGEFQIEEQALASSGITVLAPVIHGATGFGQGVEQDLADLVAGELEVSDLAEAGYALGEANDIDPAKLALVGVSYGGALALLTAGSRPGIYSAVVAIDPVADWSIEVGEAETAWRNWISRTYGMPLTNADTFALRTPATFAGVIDVPIFLIGRANAPVHRQAQLEILAATLDEYGVAYTRIDAGNEPVAASLQRAGRALAGIFREGHDTIEMVDDIRAEALG
jgi:dipeptidyl aminopeptidase/acylaminoacyl peptidase